MIRKTVLISSLILLTMFISAMTSVYACNYDAGGFCSIHWALIRALAEILIISGPLFVFTIIAYSLKNDFFDAWIKFAVIWIPLTIIISFLSLDYNQLLLPIQMNSVSFGFSIIFIIVSTIILTIKTMSSRKGK